MWWSTKRMKTAEQVWQWPLEPPDTERSSFHPGVGSDLVMHLKPCRELSFTEIQVNTNNNNDDVINAKLGEFDLHYFYCKQMLRFTRKEIDNWNKRYKRKVRKASVWTQSWVQKRSFLLKYLCEREIMQVKIILVKTKKFFKEWINSV